MKLSKAIKMFREKTLVMDDLVVTKGNRAEFNKGDHITLFWLYGHGNVVAVGSARVGGFLLESDLGNSLNVEVAYNKSVIDMKIAEAERLIAQLKEEKSKIG